MDPLAGLAGGMAEALPLGLDEQVGWPQPYLPENVTDMRPTAVRGIAVDDPPILSIPETDREPPRAAKGTGGTEPLIPADALGVGEAVAKEPRTVYAAHRAPPFQLAGDCSPSPRFAPLLMFSALPGAPGPIVDLVLDAPSSTAWAPAPWPAVHAPPACRLSASATRTSWSASFLAAMADFSRGRDRRSRQTPLTALCMRAARAGSSSVAAVQLSQGALAVDHSDRDLAQR